MKLYVLFQQLECSYDGEYAPEPVEVTNEYVMDENPAWMIEKIKKYEDDPMVKSVKLVEVSLCSGAVSVIEEALNGNPGVDASFVEIKE